jgi:hypothetical protein
LCLSASSASLIVSDSPVRLHWELLHSEFRRDPADSSLVAVVVGWWLFKGVSPDRGEVVLARFGRSTLASFPVQVFAYT